MGIQNGYGTLLEVYVRAPRADDTTAWIDFGWRAAPAPAAARAEHEAFRATLAAAGATVIEGSSDVAGDADPDAIYAYDPLLLIDAGFVVLRPGKAGRRGEPDALATDLTTRGLTEAGRLTEPACAEGGDMFFLDGRTLLIGMGYRTNEAAVEQLRAIVGPDVEVIAFDLPHLRGPGECLHLMSFISPLDADLVVAHPPLMPVRLVQLLDERGIAVVEVPGDELASMGPNVLALGPRRALALDGNPETLRRLEAAGVDVTTYTGDEISRKGDGGPTCLTRPLFRAAA